MKKSAKVLRPSEQPLTEKQAIFVKEYIRTKNGTQAALAAYDTSPNVARTMAAENLAKPNIQNALRGAFDKAGATVDKIAVTLNKWIDSDVHDASLRAISTWGTFVGANQFKFSHEHEYTLSDDILQRYAPQVDTIDVTDDAS